MEEAISDEIMDFIESKFEDLNEDSQEEVLNILEGELYKLRSELEPK